MLLPFGQDGWHGQVSGGLWQLEQCWPADQEHQDSLQEAGGGAASQASLSQCHQVSWHHCIIFITADLCSAQENIEVGEGRVCVSIQECGDWLSTGITAEDSQGWRKVIWFGQECVWLQRKSVWDHLDLRKIILRPQYGHQPCQGQDQHHCHHRHQHLRHDGQVMSTLCSDWLKYKILNSDWLQDRQGDHGHHLRPWWWHSGGQRPAVTPRQLPWLPSITPCPALSWAQSTNWPWSTCPRETAWCPMYLPIQLQCSSVTLCVRSSGTNMTAAMSTVKSKNTLEAGLAVETMSALNPFCPNTKSVCCLMFLTNISFILLCIGFIIFVCKAVTASRCLDNTEEIITVIQFPCCNIMRNTLCK